MHPNSPPLTVPLSDQLGAWLLHGGGLCPLETGTNCDTKHRDGTVTFGRVANKFDRWKHYGTPCDIVAYRMTGS